MKCPECNSEVKKDEVYCHTCLSILKLPFSVSRFKRANNKAKQQKQIKEAEQGS